MILKNILPYEKYMLVSLLTPAEIGQRIEAVIEPRNTSFITAWFRHSDKPYEGEYIGDRFRISRIISYRNSFLPDITGHIIPNGDQTKIAITMQLSPLVLVFMVVWLGTVGSLCLSLIGTGSLPIEEMIRNGFSEPDFIPFGMFIFGCLLTVIPFKIESRIAKKFLAHLFEGQETTVL